MSNLETLRDGLIEELKDLYSAEHQLIKALPKMAKKASNENLKAAFLSHLKETEGHVERLEQIGTILKEKMTGKTCKAMQGLIEEGKEVLEEESDNEELIDALIIGAAQRVEHYEIAAYGTTRAMAEEIGETEVAKLLDKTLSEEAAADKKLTGISVDEVLPGALREENVEEEDEEQKRGIQLKRTPSSKNGKRPHASVR